MGAQALRTAKAFSIAHAQYSESVSVVNNKIRIFTAAVKYAINEVTFQRGR